MKRKKCNSCGKRKAINYFFVKSDNADGHNNQCKQCHTKYVRKLRTGKCDMCGSNFYKANGNHLCPKCRLPKQEKIVSNTLFDYPRCERCTFIRECKHNIWRKTFDPYCFATAKYHGLYEQQVRGEMAG